MAIANKKSILKSWGFGVSVVFLIAIAQYYYGYKPRINDGFLNVKSTSEYNDSNFELIRRGMDDKELLSIIGSPMMTIGKNKEDVILVYTEQLNPRLPYSAREVWMRYGKVKQWRSRLIPVGQTPWQ